MTVKQNVAFTVRMPPRTQSKLRRMAKARGVSQSQFLCSLIEGRTAEAAPPKAFWDAMHLSFIHISEPTRLMSIAYAVVCL